MELLKHKTLQDSYLIIFSNGTAYCVHRELHSKLEEWYCLETIVTTNYKTAHQIIDRKEFGSLLINKKVMNTIGEELLLKIESEINDLSNSNS